MKFSKGELKRILKDIYIKNNKHWLPNGKAEAAWNDGRAHITEKDAIEAMEAVLKID